jgi:hypothetical protein
LSHTEATVTAEEEKEALVLGELLLAWRRRPELWVVFELSEQRAVFGQINECAVFLE